MHGKVCPSCGCCLECGRGETQLVFRYWPYPTITTTYPNTYTTTYGTPLTPMGPTSGGVANDGSR